MRSPYPLNYKIHLEPDLQNFKFSGTAEILMHAPGPVREVTLNALELAVGHCELTLEDGFVACPFRVDLQKEELRVSLPKEMSGQLRLKVDYEGLINDKMVGFYRSAYVRNDTTKYIAVTQFEESDARRALPCFDHPSAKATFDVEIVADENLVALSNGSITEERHLGDGKKVVKFQQTPKMSTYLLFIGVGEFEFLEDPGKPLIRVATMPGMTKYASFGLEFGRKALAYCEDYYGMAYPLSKLDLIAIPDFAFGAMENWGAVTFRENLLLHHPGITSQAGEENICGVIAHEIAHQWFGNLTTPSDWKYLWLNESFATYHGFGVVNHYRPEWDLWEQFLHGQTHHALERDALHETFPIEIPGGEHVVINASTAPLIYSKGGSVLRQIEGFIGDHNFREGLGHYLRKYAYACATSHDLWESFEEASHQPVASMMKSWIAQEGFPLVQVAKTGDRLTFKQQRFTYLPNHSEQKWIIPIRVKLFSRSGAIETVSILLEDPSTSVVVGHDIVAYKVNEKQTGFYRVEYLDDSPLNELGKRVLTKELAPEDRWGLQNDLYALVRSGRTAMDQYLDFLSYYVEENAYLPLISMAENLFHASLVSRGRLQEKVVSVGKAILEKELGDMGYEPKGDERHTTSILRDQMMFHAVLFGSEAVEEFALDKFKALMKGETIHPDIMKGVMQVGAWRGRDDVLGWFEKRLGLSDSEHERMTIWTALGKFGERDLIEKAQAYILDKAPDRNKFVPIVSMAANPKAIPFMWDWYLAHLERLEKLHPIHYERVLTAIIPVAGMGRESEVKAFFENYMGEKKRAVDVIKMSLERLEVNTRLRNR